MSFLENLNPLKLKDNVLNKLSPFQKYEHQLRSGIQGSSGNSGKQQAKRDAVQATAVGASLAPMRQAPVSGNPAYGPGRPSNQMFGLGPYNDMALRLSYGGAVPPAAAQAQAGPLGSPGLGGLGGPPLGFGGSGPGMQGPLGGNMMHTMPVNPGQPPQMLPPPGGSALNSLPPELLAQLRMNGGQQVTPPNPFGRLFS